MTEPTTDRPLTVERQWITYCRAYRCSSCGGRATIHDGLSFAINHSDGCPMTGRRDHHAHARSRKAATDVPLSGRHEPIEIRVPATFTDEPPR